jgi:hypothetical protein
MRCEGLGFGVWGLGFGVWVWGLGFRVYLDVERGGNEFTISGGIEGWGGGRGGDEGEQTLEEGLCVWGWQRL